MALTIDNISPTAINTVAGVEVVMSCEMSGSIPRQSFTVRYNNTTSPQCRCLFRKGDKVYAGFGDSDSRVLLSDDSGVTFPDTIFTVSDRGVYCVFETDSGAWLVGTIGSYTGCEIYRNGQVVLSIPSGTTTLISSFFYLTETRLIASGGNGDSSFLYYSDDDGITWALLVSYSTFSSRFTRSVLCSNGDFLIPIFSDAPQSVSGVYKIKTDSTVSKVVHINSTAVCFKISDTRIVAMNSIAPYTAFYTDDCGETWLPYTTPPALSRMSEAFVFHDGVAYAFSYTAGQGVCEWSNNGVTWTQVSLPAGYESALSSTVSERNTLLLGVGFNSGDGDILEMTPPSLPLYTASLKLDDVSVSNATNTSGIFDYNYTANLTDNGKEFQWSVTDGVSTVLSDFIPVTVTPLPTNYVVERTIFIGTYNGISKGVF